MGIFGATSPFEADVDKATSENNETESWDDILNICDKVGANTKNVKDCLKAILKRLGNNDPHVAIQAIILLDACVINCGKGFHLEIASRDFETEFRKLLSKSQPAVAMKMKLSLKKWAENEFKTDAQLNLIPSLYEKLKSEGVDFTDTTVQPSKLHPVLSKDPNVVSSQQEENDIAKAIELSLKDKGGSPKTTSSSYSSSIYPTMLMNDGASSTTSSRPTEARKVRALYDFEAAEDNELTFLAGEFIHVLDDSDPNWWKGYNHRGEGLFPSNFVSADLSVEPESLRVDNKNKKSVQFIDEIKKEDEDEIIEINEAKIDRLLHLLHEANPENPSQDSDEMLNLEAQVNQMLPLIDTELERVDRKHAQLTQLSKDLVEANNLYHTLMREPDRPIGGGYMGFPNSQPMFGPPGGHMFNMQNMYSIPQNIGPTSMPHMQSMPMSSLVGPQPMHMMPNFPLGQFAPQHMVPQHLQNGHQVQIPNVIGHINSVPLQQQQQQPQQILNQPLLSHSIGPQQNLPMAPAASMAPALSMAPPLSMAPSASMAPPISIAAPSMPQQHMPNSSQQQQTQPPQNQQQLNSIPRLSGPHFAIGSPNYQNMALPAPLVQQQHMNMNVSPHSQIPFSNQGGINQMVPHQQVPQQQMHPSQMQMQQPTMAITQPVTTTILPQSDSRTNVPIYQQQR